MSEMYYRQLSFILSLGATALLAGVLSAQAQTQTNPIVPGQTTLLADNQEGVQRVKLYYFHDAKALENILDAVRAQDTKPWGNLKIVILSNTQTSSSNDQKAESASATKTLSTDMIVHQQSSADGVEVILYGNKEERESAYRVIAAIDLPRPGITMQMWGIQISSNDPKDLAKVMLEVRGEINKTQKLMQEIYARIQQYIALDINDSEIDPQFKKLLEERLGYKSALSANRPLSITDMVLRLVAAEVANTKVTEKMANAVMETVEKDKRYRYYLNKLSESGEKPLERFFSTRGLKAECTEPKTKNDAGKKLHQSCRWYEHSGSTDYYAKVSRTAILNFALRYRRFISEPGEFSPYELQQSADVLNNYLQDTMDALNKDIEDFFVVPTLLKIQKIVRKFKDVEYAQVGRTTIASLSGIQTTVESNAVATFNVTPPLQLSDLLTEASKLTDTAGKFVPEPSSDSTNKKLMVGNLPLEQIISLAAALQKERAKFLELKTGVSFKLTPNVLRNMNSAELKIDLTIADPQFSGSALTDGVQKLPSHIGQQTVQTTVYTKAMDFFALSTFSNQSTLSGGRGYFPIIGTVWRGIFGEVPVLGKLFSWKRGPKKVLHESLLLTNSFITPTAMGMALLYPAEGSFLKNNNFDELNNCVEEYNNNLDPSCI